MESQDPMDQFADLAAVVFGAYMHIAQLLAALPIPVELPRLANDPAITTGDALMALERAREIITDEPIGGRLKREYDRLIVEWATAHELMALVKEAGPAPWRLDGIQASLIRVALIAELIEGGELDGLD